MKKFAVLCSIMFFLLAMVGCGDFTQSTTSTTSSTQTTTEDEQPIVTTTTRTLSGDVSVINAPFTNFSTQYISETAGTDIDFYYYPDKPGIPYVDIFEFIDMLSGLIDETTQVVADDADTIRVFVHYELTPEEMIEYETDESVIDEYVIFGFDDMTVNAPNVDSFDYFSGETETDFSEGLTLVSHTEEDLPAFSVVLSNYGFSFHKTLDIGDVMRYTIPLSIADLFLTGSMYDVVSNGNKLFGLDSYQLSDLPAEVSAKNEDSNTAITTESINFLAFVFDYFYGLKEYKSIPSFATYVQTYFQSVSIFEEGLYAFADSLEDMHTGVITPGHNNPTYEYYQSFDDYPAYVLDYFNEAYGCNCDTYGKDKFDLEFDDQNQIAVFQIPEFTEEFKTDIDPYMTQIAESGVDYVVLDLTCNGGGVLAGVFHLLNYLTNEDISLYSTTLGADYSGTYDVEGDLAIDAQFFILTSGVTFSAANLFTALATEMGLAKTIGTKSGGGACSVKVIVLPNGAILQMSSNMNLTYSNWLTVEEGVNVDYFWNFTHNGSIRVDRIILFNDSTRADFPTPDELLTICQGLVNP